jgi:hypothetical protein
VQRTFSIRDHRRTGKRFPTAKVPNCSVDWEHPDVGKV